MSFPRIEDILPRALAGSSGADDLVALHGIYAEAEARTARFASENGLSCPEGCGACCRGFVPDVLPVEARYLAAVAIRRGSGISDSLLEESAGDGCPFFDPDTPLHCGIYEGRALICRLFPFAAMEDKRGESAYSPCRHFPRERLAPALLGGPVAGSALAVALPFKPPLMAEFSRRLISIRPEEGGQRLPLPQALREARSAILLKLRFKELMGARPEDEPEPDDRPSSRAS